MKTVSARGWSIWITWSRRANPLASLAERDGPVMTKGKRCLESWRCEPSRAAGRYANGDRLRGGIAPSLCRLFSGDKLGGTNMRAFLSRAFMPMGVLCISLAVVPAALADVCTVGSDGKPKLSCNSPQSPKCNFNPARSEWKCLPRNAVACGSPYASWSCNPGQSCNGDGRDMAHACRN